MGAEKVAMHANFHPVGRQWVPALQRAAFSDRAVRSV